MEETWLLGAVLNFWRMKCILSIVYWRRHGFSCSSCIYKIYDIAWCLTEEIQISDDLADRAVFGGRLHKIFFNFCRFQCLFSILNLEKLAVLKNGDLKKLIREIQVKCNTKNLGIWILNSLVDFPQHTLKIGPQFIPGFLAYFRRLLKFFSRFSGESIILIAYVFWNSCNIWVKFMRIGDTV